MYMDRTFVKQTKRVPVYSMGLRTFLDNVARHKDVKERLQMLILSNIARERSGEQIDFVLVKNILSMLVALGVNSRKVYQHDFERSFLDTSRTFYHEESLRYLTENTCPDYLRKAEQRLNEEQNRVKRYLHETTGPKLIRIVEGELVHQHAQALVNMQNSGCVVMFRDNKCDDLARLYRLFYRVPETLKHVEATMRSYIVEVGKSYIKDQQEDKDPVKFIDAVLHMRDKYSVLVSDAFNSDKLLERCMKESFEEFMNVDSRCAQFLSQYCDNMLKKQLKGMSEGDVDERLDKVIVLFRYLQDRDVFSEFYKRHLSKRLLNGRSASDDAEKSMIGKLKAECGYQFTQQLEGMFTDIRLSRQTASSFAQACPPRDDEVELTVKVLTNGFWPQKQVPPCSLPEELTALSKRFEDFYLQQHQGRRLAWQCDMGMADVRARFGSKKYDLNVTTYQMCILMLFNEKPSYTFRDLIEITKIPKQELKLHMVSMTLKKYQLFHKTPKSKAVNEDDTFTVNAKFKSKMMKVRVPLVTVKSKTKAEVPKAVQEDRRQLVEAAVVRIMKTRTVSHYSYILNICFSICCWFFSRPSCLLHTFHTLHTNPTDVRWPKIYHSLFVNTQVKRDSRDDFVLCPARLL
jgi:cullin 3